MIPFFCKKVKNIWEIMPESIDRKRRKCYNMFMPQNSKGGYAMHPPIPAVKPFRRAIVIGCPGSGKSTFSRALHAATGLPLYHLDAIYWNPDRTTMEKEAFRTVLQGIVQADDWIIDGHYGSTLKQRILACDAVFLLDYPTEVCLEGIRARRGKPRSDLPWVETEDDGDFLEYVSSFVEEQRPRVLELLREHPHKQVFHFTARAEGDAFLAVLRDSLSSGFPESLSSRFPEGT